MQEVNTGHYKIIDVPLVGLQPKCYRVIYWLLKELQIAYSVLYSVMLSLDKNMKHPRREMGDFVSTLS